MSNSKRVVIFSIAMLFLVTSVALSIFVIIDFSKDDSVDTADITSQLETQQQLEAGDTSLLSGDTGETMLQGTKLENFTPVSAVDTLKIEDIVEGTGEVVTEGATVTAHYTGALAADGTIFQSSYDAGQPIPFGLNQVIEGWTKGVPGMKVGGTRRLTIPAAQAYGANSPSPDIPANADLVFDIVLVSVDQ